MANYALTVTPKFTPFTYDELIKPIETYQKVYDTYDATYEKAAEDAAKFASLDAEKDPIAYQRYQNYLQNIQKQRDALYKSGLSSSTKRGFQDLRSTYSTEIKPMEIAYDKKLEDIKNYDKLMMTNPQMRAVRNPHETSLDEYMTNDELGNRYIDLNAVHKAAVDAFSHAKQTYITKGNLGAYTYQMITRHGETPDAIMRGLQEATQDGDPATRSKAAQIITLIRDSVRNQFGYDEIDNNSIKQDMDNTIYNAAWSLQGQDDIKYVENYGARLAAQRAENDRKAEQDYYYWKKKEDYKQTQQTKNPTNNRYTTGLSPVETETKGDLKTTASDLQKTMQALQKTPKKYDKSLKSGIPVSDVNVSKLEDLYKELDEKDVEKIKGVLERYKDNPQTEGLSAGINAILNPYGLHYSPLAKKGQSVVWGEDDVRSFRQKLAKTYNYYNQKYHDLYKDDSNTIDAIAKYEALENAENTFQVYETTPHAGWLGNETSTKLYQSLKADMNSLTKITDKDGNTVERSVLPAEKDVDAIKIDTKGRLKIVSGENEYFVEMPKLKSKLRSIEIIADNMNLQPANNKKVLDLANQSDAYTIDNHLKDDYVENLGNGYTKIITKAGNNLTVHIYKNGQEVASMNQNDVLFNGSQAKLTYLENLSDDIGGEILNTYTTYKPGVNMKLEDYGVNSGQTVENTNVD